MQHPDPKPKSGYSNDLLERVAVYPALFDDSDDKYDVYLDSRPVLIEVPHQFALKKAHQIKLGLIRNGRPPRWVGAR